MAGAEHPAVLSGDVPADSSADPSSDLGSSLRWRLGHPRMRRIGRSLSWVLVVLSVVALAGAGTLYGLYRHYDGQIHRVPNLITGPGHDAEGAAAGVQNFLLVGSDDRTSLTPQELAQAHTEQDGGAVNTDVLILMHVDPRKSKVDMISFPRDSWVPVPRWTNPDGSPFYQRINAIYGLAGIHDHVTGQAARDAGARKLVEAIQSYSGLHIDHYVQVNFGGFLEITKALGGVTVCVAAPHDDRANSGAYFPHAGTYTLDAEQALAFVRERKDLLGGDLDRIERQKAFFAAVLHQSEGAGTFLNPIKLNNVLDAVTSSITADSALTLSDLKDLVDRLKHLDPAHLNFYTVPVGDGEWVLGHTALVIGVDTEQWARFFQQFGDDLSTEATPTPSGTGPPLIIAPQQIPVEVLDGAGDLAGATRVRDALAKGGFAVSAGGSAAQSDLGPTQVRFGSTRADSARSVAAALPGSQLVADPTLGDSVVVVVGAQATTVVPVRVGDPGPPAPVTLPPITGPPPINPSAAAGASAAQTGCAP